MAFDLNEARSAIRPRHRTPEPETLAPLVAAAQLGTGEYAHITDRARHLLDVLRDAQTDGWVNQFLQ
jgi:RHH-type transcriptional regulator, proline utilization regulon repressor / proline dehydrogenase / delta 1-pyrroline-5-carboxylate dehydrogenase